MTQPKGKKKMDGTWKRDRLLRSINTAHERAQAELGRLVKGVKGNGKDLSRHSDNENKPRRIPILQQTGKES